MPFVDNDKVFEQIASLHRASGLSVGEFAARYGLTRVTMSNIVNGNTQPSKQLCEALGFRVGVYVPDKPKKKR